MSIYMDDRSVARGPEEVKKNKDVLECGVGKEDEIQLEQKKVHGRKDKQRNRRRYFRTNKSSKNSKN